MPLTLLHTSDWHLGQTLYGQKRTHEQSQFLNWMVDILTKETIDILIIAGDIFDTTTPNNQTLQLYYEFLHRASKTACQHIVIVGGNHDSPALLNAPQTLLKQFNIHVIGQYESDIKDQVLSLKDASGQDRAIICAVPYLRDRDIRQVELGESMLDKDQKFRAGIKRHYQEVAKRAKDLRQGRCLPIIATGHLFTQGGMTGEGVRDLYIGHLGMISADCFSEDFDYVALGHLHQTQRVGGQARIQYSGSPLSMGFNEATQQKNLIKVVFDPHQDQSPLINYVPVPVFQAMAQIKGDTHEIDNALKKLKQTSASLWLDILYTGTEIIPNLRQRIDDALIGSTLLALRVRQEHTLSQALDMNTTCEQLFELDPRDVFERCLAQNQIPEDQRTLLRQSYQEILLNLQHAEHE